MEANGFASLELEIAKGESLKITLDGHTFPDEDLYDEASDSEDDIQSTQIEIRSDKVGVFSFVNTGLKVGDQIKKGEILGQVKGISFQDKIKCSVGGRIAKIAINDGEVVDYGRLLLVVEID